MIPVMEEAVAGRYSEIVLVCGSQMGKTDTFANIIGERLDEDPVPILYVGPTRDFVVETWEPRFRDMVLSSASLRDKMQRGKQEKKTMKRINGVKVRFAWAGSASALSGEPAAIRIVDERDRMDDDVEGEGDVVGLARARGKTYVDGVLLVASTPLRGVVDTYEDEHGFERWAVADREHLQSPTWRLWQQGTRHEFAVPCPYCGGYFILRSTRLRWPQGVSAAEASRRVTLECYRCHQLMLPGVRAKIVEKGLPVAPGQWVENGKVCGDPPDVGVYSLWISGLASPWQRWQALVYEYLRAIESGTDEDIQVAVNTGFGECYARRGETPKWQEVAALRGSYASYTIPEGVKIHGIVAAADVQKDRIYYVIRGWGRGLESWGLGQGMIQGATDGTAPPEEDPWLELQKLRDLDFGGLAISRLFVDTQYNTAQVYDFCHRNRGWAVPARGRTTLDKPLFASRLEVNQQGQTRRGSLPIWNVNSDFFKSWLLGRLNREPSAPGAFHLAADYTEDYCKQLCSETRDDLTGKWDQIRRDNHYWDCEYLAVAAAYSKRWHVALRDTPRVALPPELNEPAPAPPAAPTRTLSARPPGPPGARRTIGLRRR